jgi:hypothetical protein
MLLGFDAAIFAPRRAIVTREERIVSPRLDVIIRRILVAGRRRRDFEIRPPRFSGGGDGEDREDPERILPQPRVGGINPSRCIH